MTRSQKICDYQRLSDCRKALAHYLHTLGRQLALGGNRATIARVGYDIGVVRAQYLCAVKAIGIDSTRIVLMTNTMLHDIVNKYIGG